MEVIPPLIKVNDSSVLKGSTPKKVMTNTDSATLSIEFEENLVCKYSEGDKLFEQMTFVSCPSFGENYKCTQSLDTSNNETHYIKCHGQDIPTRNTNTQSYQINLIKT